MKSTILLVPFVAGALWAQAPDMKTLMGGAKALQSQVSGVIVKSAEKMPEENFSFKPTPEVRSFGAILGHIADAQYSFCSAVTGQANPKLQIEKTKTSKADLTQALKDAFAFCDKAYSIADSEASGVVKFFGGERTKLNVLSFNTSHNFEHYGNLVTYMRMKGLVPPSSEGR
ncbi:MAG: DinB family protein [Bryobacteraceae bacterium]